MHKRNHHPSPVENEDSSPDGPGGNFLMTNQGRSQSIRGTWWSRPGAWPVRQPVRSDEPEVIPGDRSWIPPERRTFFLPSCRACSPWSAVPGEKRTLSIAAAAGHNKIKTKHYRNGSSPEGWEERKEMAHVASKQYATKTSGSKPSLEKQNKK
ncbi:hypothetical protein ZHAS_00007386 [Anopheles sinensis]|uniref:Uncharacterized protein n=1 Tax=Anopheles sinensis TaxID=74873 RepID=A0A084VPV3_ANOSI|nr:hypothetical protein ZHAS_00007386 [Anopheles sinensis]